MLERSGRAEAIGIRELSATFSPAAGADNHCSMTIQVVDKNGVALHGFHTFLLWLSDSAIGKGLTATTSSGTSTALLTNGAELGILTAKKAWVVQTQENGTYVLDIIDDASTLFYVAVHFPGQINPVVSAVLETADYGT